MLWWRCWCNSGLLFLVLLAAVPAMADTPPATSPTPGRSRLEGLQLQPGDEPLRTFQPREPEPAETQERRAARALFMAGRVHQGRGELEQALNSYLAAVEKDPVAIEPYKSALPILLQRREYERARELTLAAAEKNKDGYDLVLAMATVFAQQDHLDDGIALLQAAFKVPGLQPGSLQELYLHRDLGLYYRLKEDFSKAAEHYRVVFEAVTGDKLSEDDRKKILAEAGQSLDEFGDVFLKAKQPDLALQAFDEASKYRDARPGLHSYNLATVFRQTGKPEKALDELQKYFDAQLQSRGRAAYDLLKDLLQELGKSSELLSRLEQMHKQDEHNDVLRFYLADELLEQGQLDRAAALYSGGRPEITDPRALVGMISVYRQQKDSARLLGVLTKAYQTVPRGNDQSVLQQLAPDVRALADRFEKEIKALEGDEDAFSALTAYARTLQAGDEPKLEFFQAYVLGELAIENDHTDDAVNFMRFAISMRNDPPALLFRKLGSHLLDAERYQEAIDVLKEAANHPSAALQREKWQFLFFLSYAYAFQGDTDRALEAIRDAQKLQPNFPRLHFQEAWIVYHAKRWDDALRLFEQVVQNYSSDKDLVQDCRFRMSNIYVEQGNMEKGEQILEDVLKDNPDNIQANNDLGYLFADQNKNLDRAEEMIKKAVEKEPENPAYLDSMGWVLYRKGKYADAVKYLEQATSQKHGEDSTILEHLGDALDQLQRHDDAVAKWKKALETEQAKKTPSEKLLKSLRSKLHLPEPAEPSSPDSKKE